MGLFSFGSKKSSQSSRSSAETFVDPAQQQYLDLVRQMGAKAAVGGFPVEDVSRLNPALLNAMQMGNQGGMQQAQTGTSLMGLGAEQTAGTGMAMNYADRALNQGAGEGIGTSFGAGDYYAGGTQTVNAAQREIDAPKRFYNGRKIAGKQPRFSLSRPMFSPP